MNHKVLIIYCNISFLSFSCFIYQNVEIFRIIKFSFHGCILIQLNSSHFVSKLQVYIPLLIKVQKFNFTIPLSWTWVIGIELVQGFVISGCLWLFIQLTLNLFIHRSWFSCKWSIIKLSSTKKNSWCFWLFWIMLLKLVISAVW